jgi:hypothetical protein
MEGQKIKFPTVLRKAATDFRRKNLSAEMAPIDDRGHAYARSRLDILLSVCVCEVGIADASMKWAEHPNLRKRPSAPSKGRGPVQRAIRRAFAASGAEVLSSSAIYEWTHPRRRLRRKKLPYGIYWRTLQALRAMCEPTRVCRRMARGCGVCATAWVLKLPRCFPALMVNKNHEQCQGSTRIVSLSVYHRHRLADLVALLWIWRMATNQCN